MDQAVSLGAEAIVFTEKDAVKIPLTIIEAKAPIPMFVICVEVTFQEGAEPFQAMLSADLQEKIAALRKGGEER